jgi:hypothetical protein
MPVGLRGGGLRPPDAPDFRQVVARDAFATGAAVVGATVLGIIPGDFEALMTALGSRVPRHGKHSMPGTRLVMVQSVQFVTKELLCRHLATSLP